MKINYERKEVHLANPSLDELVWIVSDIRSKPELDEFKIMIDEDTDEKADSEWKFCLS